MTVRVACLVPFCPRWRRDRPGAEWLCWSHWKRVPLARRKAYVRAVVERVPHWITPSRRPIPRWMAPRAARAATPRAMTAIDRLWERIKRDAIERAL